MEREGREKGACGRRPVLKASVMDDDKEDRTSRRLQHGNVIEQSQHGQHYPTQLKDYMRQTTAPTSFITTLMDRKPVPITYRSTPLSANSTRARCGSSSPKSLLLELQPGYRGTPPTRLEMATSVDDPSPDRMIQPVVKRGRTSVVGEGARPLRLRGGGSDANGGARAPNQNGSRSASTSVSATSEHDAVGQTRESTTSSSSFDLQQYQAYGANGPMVLQPQPVPLVTTTRNSSSSHLTGSSNTSEHDLSSQGWKSGTHPGPGFIATHAYQPVPLVAQHPIDTPYATAGPAVIAPYPQQLESHSRSHQPPPRAYSVSDSVTSSGTSYNGYGQPSGEGRARGPPENGGVNKGKGKALEEDDSAVMSGGEFK
jgi:hypothetical protein